MATSVINNTISAPDGSLMPGIPVTAVLVPSGAFRISSNLEIGSVPAATTSDGSGNWTLTLEQQANISPAGSYYLITEQVPQAQGGPRYWAVVVPGSNSTLRAALKTAST